MHKRLVTTSRTHAKLWCLQDGPFLWEKSTQGYILSSYYYGVFISRLPGGLLAERFGAKWTVAGFFSLSAVATFLTPTAARISFGVLILFRVLCGIGAVCFHFFCNRNTKRTISRKQDAQLSQRDRAVGCVNFWSKVEDWNWETIFYGHYRSIFNHCDMIGLQSYRIRWKTPNEGYYLTA